MAAQMHIDEGYREALRSIGLSDFRSMMNAPGDAPVSTHDDRNAVRLRVEVHGQPRELYLKRTLRHPVPGLIRDLCCGRWPRARPVREYAICKRVQELGIPAMRGVGFGQRRRWGLPHEAFVIAEAVPARASLEKALRLRADGTPRLAISHKRQLIRAVAGVVSDLHHAGLRWPDLLSKHILLNLPDDAEPESPFQLHLIDLERVHCSRSKKTRRRDLLKLLHSIPPPVLSRPDLLRFAAAYCSCANRPRAERRRILARRFAWAGDFFRTWPRRRGP